MKKIIFLIFALFVIIPCVSNISVNGEETYDFAVDNLKYEIIIEPQEGKNGTVSVMGVNNSTEVVEMPPNVSYNSNIYTVTSIGDNAFDGCSELTSIKLPDSLTSIGSRAFSGCDSLTSINLPDSLTSIGSYAFNQCRFLTSIKLPDSLTSIGSRAFSGCNSLTSINLPDSLTSIGVAVFWDCHSLTNIKLPNSITSIGDTFFSNCEELTSIDLPDSLTSIGVAAFNKCSKLTSIDLPDSLTSIGGQAFSGCSSLTSIDLPDSLTSIGGQVFSGCSSLTSIDLPDSLTSIGYASAFSGCSSLTSIDLPDSITYIGPTTFSGCSSLTSIDLSDSIINIEYKAFDGCSSLTNIELPESLTSIGEYVFKRCDNLKTVTIFADDLKKLDSNSFSYDDSAITIDKFYVVNQTVKTKLIEICGILEGKIEIINPVLYSLNLNSNQDVAGEVYGGGNYREGKTVTIKAVPQKDYKFDNWVVNSGNVTLKDKNSAQTTFKMPASDANITAVFVDDKPFIEDSKSFKFIITKEATENSKGEASFVVKDKTLTTSKLPNEVIDNKGNCYIISEVPDNAFSDCTSLEYIELPSTIISIGNNSFENCTKLANIVIPESVTTLKSNIFSNCTELENIIIKPESLTLNETTFLNLSTDVKFYAVNNEIKNLLVQNNINEAQIIVSKAKVKLQLEINNGLRVYNNNDSNKSELIEAISNLSNAISEFEQNKAK